MKENNELIEEIDSYGVEWSILKLIASSTYDGNKVEILRSLLDDYTINWGELIELSMINKLYPKLCMTLLNNEDLFKYIPSFINQYFKLGYDVNKHKNKIIIKEATKIVNGFKEAGINFACTKGIVLEATLYEAKGYRFMSDLDLMIDPCDKNLVFKVLKKLGYKIGTLDWRTNTLRELAREEYLIYMTTGDKIPEHVKEINDPIIPYVSVGFVLSFTWSGCPYHVSIKDALKTVQYKKLYSDIDEKFPVLSYSYHYIFIIMHLFKHTWVEYLRKWQNSGNISMFADVYQFWNKYRSSMPELIQLVYQYKIEKPVYWVLKNTDILFKSNIVEQLGLNVEVDNKWLYCTGDKQGKIMMLNCSINERLYGKNKVNLFKENNK